MKNILVTGGTDGIGKAIVMKNLQEGNRVFAVGSRLNDLLGVQRVRSRSRRDLLQMKERFLIIIPVRVNPGGVSGGIRFYMDNISDLQKGLQNRNIEDCFSPKVSLYLFLDRCL